MLRQILNAIYPINCVGCEKESDWLCEECLSNLIYHRPNICLFCHHRSEDDQICLKCRQIFRLNGFTSLLNYQDDKVSAIIKKAKYGKHFDSIVYLTNLIRQEIFLHLPKTALCLTAVPLHPNKLKARGFNQAEIIARQLACQYLPYKSIISRVIDTPAQASLNRKERQVNITGAFKCCGEVPREVVVVDDVATTGSTLMEIAVTLKRAGCKKVYGVTLAHG